MFDIMMENDTRGWIMTALSGVACIIGASVIYVDVLIRIFRKNAKFRIEESTGFLSASLSLSCGVMLFSALSSLLPSSKASLRAGGFSMQAASWTLILCFTLGGIGIQVFSRILHRFMPSHVVDCDHTHADGEIQNGRNSRTGNGSIDHRPRPVRVGTKRLRLPSWRQDSMEETSPSSGGPRKCSTIGAGGVERRSQPTVDDERRGRLVRRPSMQAQLSAKVLKIVSTTESKCDQGTKCRGFSGICSPDCLKSIRERTGSGLSALEHTHSMPAEMLSEHQPLLQGSSKGYEALSGSGGSLSRDGSHNNNKDDSQTTSCRETQKYDRHHRQQQQPQSHSPTSSDHHDHHHHHVPDNAFLSVGLQTSLAIALHKLPEGFITYATNHANPKLGFSVFLAIFVHNITEGFAMALPLYLAIKSRPRAILWSALLGGASQPLGAGIAVLWFFLSGSGVKGNEGEGAYGVLFAITAGIMASVALQLFSEAINLNPNRAICMLFAFVGMGIMGMSSALTS